MNSDKLQAIARRSCENLSALFAEGQDEILEAIAAAAREAEAQDADKLVVTLRHAIKLDLTRNSQNDSLAWSVSHKIDTANAIPDPDQPELLPE